MKRLIPLIVSCLCIYGFSNSRELIEGNRYLNRNAGISITKPQDWHFSKLDKVIEDQIEFLTDDQLKSRNKRDQYLKRLKTLTGMEPIIITKLPLSHPDINPSFQVVLAPLNNYAGSSPVTVMLWYLEKMSRHQEKFTLKSKIEKMQISNLPGMKATYSSFTKNKKGEKIEIITDFWIVIRGNHVFQIGFNRPKDSSKETEEEGINIIQNIKIKPFSELLE